MKKSLRASKKVFWLYSTREQLKKFPHAAMKQLGQEVARVQREETPLDFKPMNSIGLGVMEIRYRGEDNQYRLFYIAKFQEGIYVLHVFIKTTQATPLLDLQLAKKRYRELLNDRKEKQYE